MVTDIKLNDRFVTVEASALRAQAWDIMLDSPDRRTRPTPEFRRALVHNFGDKLTVNYAKDYPGGVEIEGSTSFTEDVKIRGAVEMGSGVKVSGAAELGGSVKVGGDLTVGNVKIAAPAYTLKLEPAAALTLGNGSILVQEPAPLRLSVFGKSPGPEPEPPPPLDLVQEVKRLRQEVNTLTQQMQALRLQPR